MLHHRKTSQPLKLEYSNLQTHPVLQLVSRFPNRTLSISRHIPPVRVEYTSSIPRIDFIIALGISIFSPSFSLAEAKDDREGRGPS